MYCWGWKYGHLLTPNTANWALHSNRYCRFLASSLDSAGHQCQPEVQFTKQHAIGLSTVRHLPHRGQRLLQPGSDRRTARPPAHLELSPACMTGAVMQNVIPLSLPPRRTAWCRRRSTCRCGCASRGRSRPASSGRRPPPPALPQRRYRCPHPECFVRATARPLLALQT